MKPVAVLLVSLFAFNAHAWDPVKDLTGKRLDQHWDRSIQDLRNAPESWGRCFGDPAACAEKELRRIPFRAVWPLMERYKAHLFNQAHGRWQALPPDLIARLQPHYSVNLQQVRIAQNINTIHGAGITWENSIFFPRYVNLSNRGDMHWLLHELEHTVHYRNKGGFRELFGEYFVKSVGKILRHGTFNPHDYIDLERAADRKANALINLAMAPFTYGPPYQNRPFGGGPPGFAPPPRMSSACYTAIGVCGMQIMAPMGTQCTCPTPYGPVVGLVQ